MHNTPLQNAEFALTFTETNLHWLLGAEPQDNEAIERCKAQITERKKEVITLTGSVPPWMHNPPA